MKFNLLKIHLIQQLKDSMIFLTQEHKIYVILKLYSLLNIYLC